MLPEYSQITLETPRLILREFEAGDAEAIQVYAGDPEVTRFTSWGPNTPEMTASVLAGWLKDQLLSLGILRLNNWRARGHRRLSG